MMMLGRISTARKPKSRSGRKRKKIEKEHEIKYLEAKRYHREKSKASF